MSNFLRRLGSSNRRDDSSSSNAIIINSQQQSANNNLELMKSINTQEINMAKIDQHLHNWNIPPRYNHSHKNQPNNKRSQSKSQITHTRTTGILPWFTCSILSKLRPR